MNIMQQAKPIKQIFSNEIKDKVKNIGDYAFLIDKNDYVIKIDDRTHVFLSKFNRAQQRLDLLNSNYLINLNKILIDIYESINLNYSNYGYLGYTLHDENTILVAFENLENAKNITIPFTVLQIIDTTEKDPMFHKDSNLKSIIFSDNLQVIGTNTFRELAGITKVAFREGLLEIRAQAFEYCTGLNSLVLPKSVLKIGDRAFYNTALDTVVLPHNIVEIGSKAFANIPGELTVYLMANPNNLQINLDTFDIVDLTKLIIFVPENYLHDYKTKLYSYSNNIYPLRGGA